MVNIATGVESGKVAVLKGGYSAERAVSLKSAENVVGALQRLRIPYVEVDPGLLSAEQVIETLQTCERVFVVLHGRGGEDGVIQGLLEFLQKPYTGSGVQASSLCMNKFLTKAVWSQRQLRTPASFLVTPNMNDPVREVMSVLAWPVVIKPEREGSSLGMSRADNEAELRQGLEYAGRWDADVLVEQWIEGREYTVGILGKQILPSILVQTPNTFYDYAAKYEVGTTQYHCPSGLEPEAEAELGALCLEAYQALGCSGWGRVDVMQDVKGQNWLIEVNTVPGLTQRSLVPMAAQAIGIGFDVLVLKILETASLETTGLGTIHLGVVQK